MNKEVLRIQNFGPIKHIEIPLNRFLVLIGESGSGKSAIMKTASLVKFIYKKMQYKRILKESKVKKDPFRLVLHTLLKASELDDFWRKDSLIEFLIDGKLIIKFENEKIFLNYDNLEKKIMIGKIAMINDFRSALPELLNLNKNLPFLIDDMAINFREALREFNDKFQLSTMNLELSKQGRGFLTEYVLENKGYKVKLKHSSSGEKNVSVMELICDYFAKKYDFSDSLNNAIGGFVLAGTELLNFEKLSKYLKENKKGTFLNLFIEAPENNLFPTQQKKIACYLVSLLREKNKPNIMIATHSPYILTTLNNLLFAGQLYVDEKTNRARLNEIVDEKYTLKQDEFSAYFVSGGEIFDLVSKNGVMRVDEIDEVSTQIADEFDSLLDLKDFDED